MHPGCLQAIFLLEDGFRNVVLALSAKLEQSAPIFITVTNAVPSKDSFPGYCVHPHSSVEIAKYHDLVIWKIFRTIT